MRRPPAFHSPRPVSPRTRRVNTTIGALSTTDPDASNTFTYSLVNTGPCPGTDNASFNILDNALRTNAVFNAGVKSSYAICVRSSDQGALTFDKAFTITVTVVNQAPTAIGLSAGSIEENLPANTALGILTTTDPNIGNTFTYSLVSTGACPGPDNSAFVIQNDALQSAAPFNYEAQSGYAICVRSTDQGSLTVDQAFLITIIDVNEAATLITLSSTQVVIDAPAGTSVGTLAANDPDAGDTLSFVLTPGYGDNSLFTITGSVLALAQPVTRAAGESYAIQVQESDGGGLGITQTFSVQVVGSYFVYLPSILR